MCGQVGEPVPQTWSSQPWMWFSPFFCIKSHHLHPSFSPSDSPCKNKQANKKTAHPTSAKATKNLARHPDCTSSSWMWPQVSSGSQHCWSISSSLLLFQTFYPLTSAKPPSPICTMLLYHFKIRKQTGRVTLSLHPNPILFLLSAPPPHPGSRPSHLPSESPPEKIPFIPES